MGQIWLRCLGILGVCFFCVSADGNEPGENDLIQIKRVVIFGDSLADTGNTWELTRYLNGVGEKPWFYDELFGVGWEWLPMKRLVSVIPPPGYDHGRFSNGPLAGELVMNMLGMDASNPSEMVNLAFGGSWTVPTNHFVNSWISLSQNSSVSMHQWFRHLVGGTGKWLLPSSSEVVDWYLKLHRSLDSETLYVLESGANDYQNRYWDVNALVNEQILMIQRLINAGARHIGWGTLPDLTFTPCFRGSGETGEIEELVKQHNRGVTAAKRALEARYPQVKIIFIDSYSAMKLFFQHADSFGFTVTDRGCTNINITGCPAPGEVFIDNAGGMTVCSNPDEHFFWDSIHPTTRIHEHVATYICVMVGLRGYWTDCQLPSGFNRKKVETLYELIVEEQPLSVVPDRAELKRLLKLEG
ncbi:SGNH/GDSL hydrolase family protein [Parendozoicomonas sp. Alg238-R29]|uniref:SGNH/GDSL hydrolase family protein n=1 Tax=Parendozoicomonas sp. Alg238-R29 TaxID=2993446 RepID=UPI00248EBAF1|nr:SGNH/GDSL hydrolase family protein [Parendozoicomonas sp. Alg238-R29]